MPQYLRATLCPDQNEPYRASYYESSMKSELESLELLKKEREKAAPEIIQAYDAPIAEAEARIKDMEENEWAADAEAIAEYRKRAEHLYIPTSVGLNNDNAQEVTSLLQRYADKQIPMEQFISSIDQKLRMMEMEGH